MNIECDQSALEELESGFRFNDAILRSITLVKKEAITEPSKIAEATSAENKPTSDADKTEKVEPNEKKQAEADKPDQTEANKSDQAEANKTEEVKVVDEEITQDQDVNVPEQADDSASDDSKITE
jgi:small subunit ribosomal protein S6